MIIAQVCLMLATIKGLSKMCSFTVRGGHENQSVSGVTTICLTQCNTSPSHGIDQVVDYGLWNVGPLQWLCEVAGYWQELEHSCRVRRSKASQTCSMGDMSSHLNLYSAFNNTNCVKETAQYQNRKIVYH